MKNESTTVKKLMQEWWNIHCQNLAKSTQFGYQRYIDAYILPKLGRKQITAICQRDIQSLINYISFIGKSTKTQKNLISILHSIFEYALINRMIDINPVKQIVTKKTAPYEYYIYSKEEYDKLIEVFRESIDIIPVLLGGVCGLRLSEVFGLKWNDIDFKKNEVHIRRAAVSVGGIKIDIKPTTKTAAGNRTISVPADSVRSV